MRLCRGEACISSRGEAYFPDLAIHLHKERTPREVRRCRVGRVRCDSCGPLCPTPTTPRPLRSQRCPVTSDCKRKMACPLDEGCRRDWPCRAVLRWVVDWTTVGLATQSSPLNRCPLLQNCFSAGSAKLLDPTALSLAGRSGPLSPRAETGRVARGGRRPAAHSSKLALETSPSVLGGELARREDRP